MGCNDKLPEFTPQDKEQLRQEHIDMMQQQRCDS